MLDLLGLELRTLVLASTVGAGNRTVELDPGEGEEWIVIDALGYHDNAGNLNGRWMFGPTGAGVFICPSGALASWVRVSCYERAPGTATNKVSLPIPIKCDSINFLQWAVDSLGAGEKAYVLLIILVLRGVPLRG